jgi:hypothetical protein
MDISEFTWNHEKRQTAIVLEILTMVQSFHFNSKSVPSIYFKCLIRAFFVWGVHLNHYKLSSLYDLNLILCILFPIYF